MDSTSNKLNLLVAYPYCKADVVQKLAEHKDRIRLVLDSGAFTAWKAGKPIQVDDYCRFIESLPFKPWRYFTLDAIGNAKATRLNYEIMLKRGFTPVPIFTRGEAISELEEYYKTSDVVGIGGLVGTQGNTGFVKGIMKVIGNRRAHWLGFVRHDYINHYRPYMCDASSWSHASRNGDLKVYLGGGKIKSFRKVDFMSRPDQKVLALFESYGISAKDLASADNWKNHKWLNSSAARMWVRRSIETEKKLGTHLFLACASKFDIDLCLNGFEKETA